MDTGAAPETGGGTPEGGAVGDGGGATFTQVYQIIMTSCLPCHATGAGATTGMLNMSTQAMAYTNLVGKMAAGAACNGMGTRVIAGNATMSLLVNKVGPGTPRCGMHMPRGAGHAALGDERERHSFVDQRRRSRQLTSRSFAEGLVRLPGASVRQPLVGPSRWRPVFRRHSHQARRTSDRAGFVATKARDRAGMSDIGCCDNPEKKTLLVGRASLLLGKVARPVGRAPFLLGKAARPVGRASFLLGKAARPVGTASFPLGKAARPVGTASFPLGKAARTCWKSAFSSW